MKSWLIYGANGYTGSLIAREAKRRGLSPILAGRNSESCAALGRELDLPVRAFSLSDPSDIAKNLEGVSLVLHCAGPFSATSKPMLEACLQAKAHYLDITGEIPVFENVHGQSERIREAGIVAIPGVGFDVVPTDCLAAMLKAKMPDASKLALAFKGSGSFSPGTLKTMIEGIASGGAVRRNGEIVSVPPAFKTRKIRFEVSTRLAMTIPWGDVSTAFYSTGIPDIEVYLPSSPGAIRMLGLSNMMKPILAMRATQNFLKTLAGKYVQGPDEEERTKGKTIVWGEVENRKKQKLEMRLKVPESYQFTVLSTLASVEKVMAGAVGPGAWTPSKAFGAEFVLSLPGVQRID
jgi:short subunit dehydrogenase-like uncharacterized protein